jgi:hypothetical protein
MINKDKVFIQNEKGDSFIKWNLHLFSQVENMFFMFLFEVVEYFQLKHDLSCLKETAQF